MKKHLFILFFLFCNVFITNAQVLPLPIGAGTITTFFIKWDPAHQPGVGSITFPSTYVLRYNGTLTGNYGSGYSTAGKSSGIWYVETVCGVSTGNMWVGIANAGLDVTSLLGSDIHGWGYRSTIGKIDHNGGLSTYGSSWATGDVIGICINFTSGCLFFSKNGTWQNGATAASIVANSTTGAAATGLTGTLFIGWGGDPSNVLTVSINGNSATWTYSDAVTAACTSWL